MQYLRFTLYNKGQCGISNAVMSLECGLGLALLLDRALVLEGNHSPTANLVSHLGLPNDHRARITDLYEMPLPWVEAEDFENLPTKTLRRRTLCSEPLHSALFYWPPTLKLDDPDLLLFANGKPRTNFLTARQEDRNVDVLEVDGSATLSFYSYFFYLPAPQRATLYAMLRRFHPKACYREFAARVAATIGDFNAAHIRLGDFRATYGTTTNDRSPADVLDALEPHFETAKTLVICTDESDNTEFFRPILARYPRALFLEPYILNDAELRRAFLELPYHDDMALALVSQLVAAASQNFIGSMTSTFTAMIQRMRGNLGKAEDFKFLWNEIPDPGAELERGRHARGQTIAFRDGRLLETRQGPYSWNRLDLWVGCEYYAWFREWPESFLAYGDEEPGRIDENDDHPDEYPDHSAGTHPPAVPREINVKIHLRDQQTVSFNCLENDLFLHELFGILNKPRRDGQTNASALLHLPGKVGSYGMQVATGSLVAIETQPPVDPAFYIA
jgi:hypothetical protein